MTLTIAEQVEQEILGALADAEDEYGADRAWLLVECPSAMSLAQVSRTLNRLSKEGRVEKVDGGRWRLAPQPEPQAGPDSPLEIPRLGGAGPASPDPIFTELGRLRSARPFPAAEYRAEVCQALAEHELTEDHPKLREFFEALAADLQAAA